MLNFCVGRVNISVVDDEAYEISNITPNETSLVSTEIEKSILDHFIYRFLSTLLRKRKYRWAC
jgi:hypothetical protein